MKKDNGRTFFRTLPSYLKFSSQYTLVGSIISLVHLLVFAWFIQRNYSLFTSEGIGLSPQVIETVKREQTLLEISLLLLFLFSIFTFFTYSFYITRKMFGPIESLKRQLRVFSQGDWSKEFKLRKEDEFREFEGYLSGIRNQILGKK